jgi:hypothetical protein
MIRRRLAVLSAGCAALAVLVVTFAVASTGAFVIAGSGTLGFLGDGGPATSAQLQAPAGAAPTSDGGYLIADTKNHRVRRVARDGTITTVAGTGVNAYAGDGGSAALASLNEPTAVAVTPDGGYLIADSQNHAIRKVDAGGIISTIAGTGVNGSTGDGGPATSAQLKKPTGVALTGDGGFVIAEHDGNRVRKVAADGTISTIAGGPSAGFGGDGGPATSALLNGPSDVAAAADGAILVADTSNNRIRRVAPDGIITTVAGNGATGHAGDGGPATNATLTAPEGILGTADGGFVIADGGNDAVRQVTPEGTISMFLGGKVSEGDAPVVDHPADATLTSAGRLVVAEVAGHQVTGLDTALAPVDVTSGAETDATTGDAAADTSPTAGDAGDTATPSGDASPTGDAPTTSTGTSPGTAGAPAQSLAPPAPPVAGKRMNAAPVRGRVKVRLPGQRSSVWVVGAASIPVGATVDATRGAVRIETVPAADGSRQAAVFSHGAFRIAQARGRHPVTSIVLSGGDRSICRRAGVGRARRSRGATARAASVRRSARRRSGARVIRRVWGSGRGRFRTHGRTAVAAVRGTSWLTVDRCDGTLVRVREGAVGVKPTVGGRTVMVRRGESRFVRGRRR